MNKEYFQKYGSGGSLHYKESLWDYTVEPYNLLSVIENGSNIEITSVFDIGAADGTWLNYVSTYRNSIYVGGIEIYKPIINHPFVTNDSILDYKFNRKWDVIYLNGLQYFNIEQVQKILSKVKSKCKFLALAFETWPKVNEEKYAKTILDRESWLSVLYDEGWHLQSYVDPAFVFVYSKEKRYKALQIDWDSIPAYVGRIHIDKKVAVTNSVKFTYYSKKGKHVVKISGATDQQLVNLTPYIANFTSMDSDISVVTSGRKIWHFIPGWCNTPEGNLTFIYLPL